MVLVLGFAARSQKNPTEYRRICVIKQLPGEFASSHAVEVPEQPLSSLALQYLRGDPNPSGVIERNAPFFSDVPPSFLVEMLAYLDETIALVNSIRGDAHRYINNRKGEIRIRIATDSCSPSLSRNVVDSLKVGKQGELILDLSTLNLSSETDWSFLFQNRTIDELTMEEGLFLSNDYEKAMKIHEQYKSPRKKQDRIKAFVINLISRPDRLEKMSRLLNEIDMNFERYDAVVGKDINLADLSVRRVFGLEGWKEAKRGLKNPHGNHGFSPPVIGNALSHIGVFGSVSSDSTLIDNDFVLILEDDIDSYSSGFQEQYKEQVLTLQKDQTWDIHFLGIFDEEIGYILYDDLSVHHGIREFNRNVHRSFGGGSHAYFIRKRAAKRIIDAIEGGELKVSQATDWWLLSLMNSLGLTLYKSVPNLLQSRSVLEDRGREMDSDVGEIGQSTKSNDRLLSILALHNSSSYMMTELADLSFTIAHPSRNSSLKIGRDDTSVRITIQTKEDPTMLMERHQGSKLCGQCVEDVKIGSRGGNELCFQLADSHKLSLDELVANPAVNEDVVASCRLKVWLVSMYGDVVAEDESSVTLIY